MVFRGDERGQPVQIGFILLFGILVLAFSSYQAFVVPQQNAEVEFTHSQTVQDEFSELQSTVVNAVGNDDDRSIGISLGVQYPSRLVALNPPPATGSIETTEPRDVEIAGTTDPVCRADGGTATSQSLVYTPGYNEYREAESTIYENTFVTRTFQDGAVYGDQQLVKTVDSGPDKIDLLLLNGSVEESGTNNVNIRVNGTHRYSTTVSNPTITLPSEFTVAEWRNEILAERSDVDVTGGGGGRVQLDFTGGEYRVSCAVVGLNGDPAFVPPSSSATDGGNATYDVRWDVSKIIAENGPVRNSDNADIEIDSGATVNSPGFFVDATNRSSGAPINGVVIDAGHGGGIVSSLNDSNAVTGANGTDGETPGFEVVFESNTRRGTLYADGGDDVDAITVDLVPPSFERLEGSSNAVIGNPTSATFIFTLTSSAEITLTAAEAGGSSGNKTSTTQSDTVTVRLGNLVGNLYPVELQANITNGECLQTTLQNESETATLSNDDWNEC
jgi:hypothetical protein